MARVKKIQNKSSGVNLGFEGTLCVTAANNSQGGAV